MYNHIIREISSIILYFVHIAVGSSKHILFESWCRLNRAQSLHTDKSFRNLNKSTWNQIVFTIFRLIWNQTDVRLVPNQPQIGEYNLISVWFNKIWKDFSVYTYTLRNNGGPGDMEASVSNENKENILSIRQDLIVM